VRSTAAHVREDCTTRVNSSTCEVQTAARVDLYSALLQVVPHVRTVHSVQPCVQV
jgi:hypothetical protein